MTDTRTTLDPVWRDRLVPLIAIVSLLNGLPGSPLFEPMYFLLRPFAASFYIGSPMLKLYFTSMFLSLMTLLIGGVPAALYERFRRLPASTPLSLGLWLAGVVAATAPSWLAFIAPR